MIEPQYLAELRRRHRTELVLLLVQLEAVCPGTWDSLSDLADLLGTERVTLNKSLVQLRRLGLVAYASRSNSGGTWLWWVSRFAGDAPSPEAEPCWRLTRIDGAHTCDRVPLTGVRPWAERHGIPWRTVQAFLAGHQRTLAGTWRLSGTPYDTAFCETP